MDLARGLKLTNQNSWGTTFLFNSELNAHHKIISEEDDIFPMSNYPYRFHEATSITVSISSATKSTSMGLLFRCRLKCLSALHLPIFVAVLSFGFRFDVDLFILSSLEFYALCIFVDFYNYECTLRSYITMF